MTCLLFNLTAIKIFSVGITQFIKSSEDNQKKMRCVFKSIFISSRVNKGLLFEVGTVGSCWLVSKYSTVALLVLLLSTKLESVANSSNKSIITTASVVIDYTCAT